MGEKYSITIAEKVSLLEVANVLLSNGDLLEKTDSDAYRDLVIVTTILLDSIEEDDLEGLEKNEIASLRALLATRRTMRWINEKR